MKLLIIGILPPPVGGVSIHVSRLLDHLSKENIPHSFLSLSHLNLLIFPFFLFFYDAVHLHTSNLYVQYYVSMLCKLFSKKSIVTFHGDLNRFSDKKLRLVKYIIGRISVPVVLNEESYELAKLINPDTQLISAFIPPLRENPLGFEIDSLLRRLNSRYKAIYATNAFAFTYDKNRNEIYGILDLIRYFNERDGLALIISDPSSDYSRYIRANNTEVGSNIFFICQKHSFFEILKNVDACIRNTSTDGDSLSVKESLYLGKATFVTDVVSRPEGCLVYKRGFYNFDLTGRENAASQFYANGISGISSILKLYSNNETDHTII